MQAACHSEEIEKSRSQDHSERKRCRHLAISVNRESAWMDPCYLARRLFPDSLLMFLPHKLPATFGMLRKTGAVPSSTERLDQLDGCNHSPPEDVHRRNFVGKRRTLSDGHFEVAGDATVVSCDREF